MSEYKLKPGKVGESIISAYKKVEDGFTDTFLEKDVASEFDYKLKTGKVGDVVVNAYKKVEDGVVGG